MKRLLRVFAAAAALLCLGSPLAVWAGPADEDDPGRGTCSGPTCAQGNLHLRSHAVGVVINNGFATTQVDQVLANSTKTDLEAIWAFPLPEQASLSELSLWIAGKRVIGEVVEKKEARRIYREERDAGRNTALAEQNEYYDYRIDVGRVPADGEVRVRIVYYQPLDIEAGVGRYLYPLQEGNTDDMRKSFWTMEKQVAGDLTFDVTLKTAFPVDGLHCPSHPGFQATQKNEDEWHGTFKAPGAELDRDFVLHYRLLPDEPARVEFLTHRDAGAGEGTFMAVVTPGADLAPIEHGTDWAFVLDVSGSMKGDKIRTLRRGVAKALGALGANDRVHLVHFSNTAGNLTPGFLDLTPENVGRLQSNVEGLRADGGTNVMAGLNLALHTLDADRPAGIILVSDGVANVGPHAYRNFIGLVRQNDVRLFTFAIGNSANLRLMRDLATESGGASKTVSVQDEIGAHLMLAKDRMTHQALHGVTFELPGAVAVHPRTLPSLYLGQQLVVFGRYDATGPATLKVSAKISGKPATWTIPVDLPQEDASNPELERLYAVAAITDLERERDLGNQTDDEMQSAILDMALRYSLVTDYTSMIVLEEDQKAARGITNANADRRAREEQAALQRTRSGNRVQVASGRDPLAGRQAQHAPSRHARPSRGGGGSSGGGGGGGMGALGPFTLIPLAGLALLALRRKRRKD